MKPKFNMTIEDNIFFAKRNIIDYIWKSARMEGIGVTFPETDTICNYGFVNNMMTNDVITINNLKHAWQFVLENIDIPMEYLYICEIHHRVGANLIKRSGFIRNMPVKIGGMKWIPDLPIESKIKEELGDILTIKGPTEKAITLMLYIMRRQMFYDGNKRAGMFAGNHVMISNGAGIISIPIELQKNFFDLLIRFYKTNQMDEIMNFVYTYCIDGEIFEGE